MKVNISTMDKKGRDVNLSWDDFTCELYKPENSIQELKRKERKGIDINPYPSYHIHFLTPCMLLSYIVLYLFLLLIQIIY